MRGNAAKEALKAGKTVVGTMLTELRSPEVLKALSSAGLDFIFIDTEHAAYDLQTVTDMIRAGRSMGLSCYVRVTDAEYHLIARTLDVGAHGIMIPRVETKEQVERAIAASKYPPKGKRGYGVRSIITDFERASVNDLIEKLNDDTMIITQIESKKAIESIDRLISVEGVDAAVIGPNDLSISLGVPGQQDHPLMVKYVDKVVEACEKQGIPSGIHVRDMDLLKQWRDKGMRLLTYSTDIHLLINAAKDAVKQLKQ